MPIFVFDKRYGGLEGEVKGQISLSARLFLRYFSKAANLGCDKAQICPKRILSPGIRAMGSRVSSPFLNTSAKLLYSYRLGQGLCGWGRGMAVGSGQARTAACGDEQS